MADVEAFNSNHTPTVFLSYASGDREAARILKEALITLRFGGVV